MMSPDPTTIFHVSLTMTLESILSECNEVLVLRPVNLNQL